MNIETSPSSQTLRGMLRQLRGEEEELGMAALFTSPRLRGEGSYAALAFGGAKRP